MTVVRTNDRARPTRRYMSLQEAAVYTGLDVKTLRRRISDGTLTAYRAGSRVLRIDANEIDAQLFTVVPSAASGT